MVGGRGRAHQRRRRRTMKRHRLAGEAGRNCRRATRLANGRTTATQYLSIPDNVARLWGHLEVRLP